MNMKKIGLSLCASALVVSIVNPVHASAILLGNKADPTDANSRAVVKMQKIVNENTQEGIARSKIEMCSGVLIAPQWILTTGSCAINFSPDSNGNFTQDTTIMIGPDVETAEKVTPVQSYSAITEKGLDFGLVKLKEEAKTAPAKITTIKKELDRGEFVDLYGWGASMIETVNDEGKTVLTREKVDTNKAEISSPIWFKEKPGYKNQNTDNFPNSNIQMLGTAKAVEGDQGGPLFYDGSVYGILSIGYPTDPTLWDENNSAVYDKFNSGKAMIAPVYAVNDWIESTTGIDIEKNNKEIDKKVAGKSFEFKKDDGSTDRKTDYYYYNEVFEIDPEIALIPYKENENSEPKGNPVEKSPDKEDSKIEDPNNPQEENDNKDNTGNDSDIGDHKESKNEGKPDSPTGNKENTGDIVPGENPGIEDSSLNKENSIQDEKSIISNNIKEPNDGRNHSKENRDIGRQSNEKLDNRNKEDSLGDGDDSNIVPIENLYKDRSKDNNEKGSGNNKSTERNDLSSSSKKVNSINNPDGVQKGNSNGEGNKSGIIPKSIPNSYNSELAPSYNSGPVVDTGGRVNNVWNSIINFFK